jgi:hypothetical protein
MFASRFPVSAIPLQMLILALVSAPREESCRLPNGHVCIPGGSCCPSPDSRVCNSPLLCALGSKVELGRQLPYQPPCSCQIYRLRSWNTSDHGMNLMLVCSVFFAGSRDSEAKRIQQYSYITYAGSIPLTTETR